MPPPVLQRVTPNIQQRQAALLARFPLASYNAFRNRGRALYFQRMMRAQRTRGVLAATDAAYWANNRNLWAIGHRRNQ